jgi:urea transport system permease protein
MCYAIVAVAMDLIWGYAGILSLGHGLFFALGGYAFGMYLMRQIGRDGSYQSDLPDFMVFLDWKELPWYWTGSDSFLWALFLVLACRRWWPRLRLLRLPLAHQGRVFLDHHPGHDLRRDAVLLPQRDRLRRQQRLHRLQAHPRLQHHRAGDARACSALSAADAAGDPGARPLPGHLQVRPGAGGDPRRRVRVMFIGYNPLHYKLFIWTLSAMLCGIAGALYVPQVGIINPGEMSPANSIEIAIWVAVGGRGTLIGPVHRRLHRQSGQELFTVSLPRILAVLPRRLLFIGVTLWLPEGVVGLWQRSRPAARRPPFAASRAADPGAAERRKTPTALPPKEPEHAVESCCQQEHWDGAANMGHVLKPGELDLSHKVMLYLETSRSASTASAP